MSEPASYKQERPKQIDWHSSTELNMEEKKTHYLFDISSVSGQRSIPISCVISNWLNKRSLYIPISPVRFTLYACLFRIFSISRSCLIWDLALDLHKGSCLHMLGHSFYLFYHRSKTKWKGIFVYRRPHSLRKGNAF